MAGRNPKFDTLIEELKKLHDSKSEDYAEAEDPMRNLRRCQAFGIPPWKGCLVRLSDKQARIEQLANGKKPNHESLRDSLIDQAIYSILTIILLDEL